MINMSLRFFDFSNDANDKIRPQDELDLKGPPPDSIPEASGIPSPWNATEPTEIQLRSAMRLVGEPQTNGRPTPLLLCGYVFRQADILNWMDSRQLIPELKRSPMDRSDKGWSYVMNTLGPHGISCWLVRTYFPDEYGNRTKSKCTAMSLILGSNETKKDRIATRNMKKIELIHKVLNIPMGALGAPEWLIPA
ncbi:hypothetical protein HYPSUDRAFT_1030149 [Hypholoma sublateritium FD-334 SS-4]|uniref:Uncharacterized protein n=1 Tax=Hypholoma sublateritium (strain FD-334 SS-4) TaxID=945553 RepID=A0A0D2MS09_HYPSF|nr:hypothetical protein HYPSUDRAFT_1030149 [Hypholoma sublateritium FD-334 SS-4]